MANGFGAGSLTSLGLPTATGSSGGGGILGLLGGLKGGLPGLGFNIGGQLLSFLGGGGARGRKKDIFRQLGQLANIAGSERGKPIFNVEDITAQTVAGAHPILEKRGKEFDRRFGFDQCRYAVQRP